MKTSSYGPEAESNISEGIYMQLLLDVLCPPKIKLCTFLLNNLYQMASYIIFKFHALGFHCE